MTTRTGATWFVRFGLVVVLSGALSGVARVASAATGAPDTCAEQRGGNFGCPPTCAGGTCARISPAILAGAADWFAAARAEPWTRDERRPPAPPPLDGVFHPPTRLTA